MTDETKAKGKAAADKSEEEVTWTADELRQAAATFDTTPAGITAALELAGKTEATKAQMESYVKKFNEREV